MYIPLAIATAAFIYALQFQYTVCQSIILQTVGLAGWLGFTALKHNICYIAPLSEVNVRMGARADLVYPANILYGPHMGSYMAPYGSRYGTHAETATG